MRRRWPAAEAKESIPPVKSENSEKCDRVANPSSVCVKVGDVCLSGMAEEGVGRPVSGKEILKPCMTDLGSESEVSSDEDDSSDSDDSGNDGRFDSNNSLSCDGGRAVPNLSVDGKAILPAGGAVSSPIQQASNITSFGNINLNKSSGIHIGNKTVYQGPVTIQQYVVKHADESLQVKVGPLAITDGSETGTAVHISGSTSLKRSGLELNTGSFRIGASAVAASKGSGLLWRHLLGRRPGAATLAAWIALGLGCMALVAIVLAVVYFLGKKEQPSPSTSDADLENEEVNNGYRSPAKQQSNKKKRLLSCTQVIPRSRWGAKPPREIQPLRHPVGYVIISHTASAPCYNVSDCSTHMRIVQNFHLNSRNWADIGYNFLVGGDGNAYEGRGWDRVGAHSKGMNDISIGISFIGTYIDVLPPPAQIRACKMLIEEGVCLGKISPDYKLLGHRQVSPTESPGQKLYEELQKWDHWSSEI